MSKLSVQCTVERCDTLAFYLLKLVSHFQFSENLGNEILHAAPTKSRRANTFVYPAHSGSHSLFAVDLLINNSPHTVYTALLPVKSHKSRV